MNRKIAITSMALVATLGLVIFAGYVGLIGPKSPRQEAASFLGQDLPIGSSLAQVEAWLKPRHVRYHFVPKTKMKEYGFQSDTAHMRDVRKIVIVNSSDSPELVSKFQSYITIVFFFDKGDRVIYRDVYPYDN